MRLTIAHSDQIFPQIIYERSALLLYRRVASTKRLRQGGKGAPTTTLAALAPGRGPLTPITKPKNLWVCHKGKVKPVTFWRAGYRTVEWISSSGDVVLSTWSTSRWLATRISRGSIPLSTRVTQSGHYTQPEGPVPSFPGQRPRASSNSHTTMAVAVGPAGFMLHGIRMSDKPHNNGLTVRAHWFT